MIFKNMTDEQLGAAMRLEHEAWAETLVSDRPETFIDAARDGFSIKTFYEAHSGLEWDNCTDDGTRITAAVPTGEMRWHEDEQGAVSLRYVVTYLVTEYLTRQGYGGSAPEGITVEWAFDSTCTLRFRGLDDDDPDCEFDSAPIQPSIVSERAMKLS